MDSLPYRLEIINYHIAVGSAEFLIHLVRDGENQREHRGNCSDHSGYHGCFWLTHALSQKWWSMCEARSGRLVEQQLHEQ